MTYPLGIDVSRYQKQMDWSKAASAGVKFAFVKATEGTGIVDSEFARNWDALRHSDILHGAYHFFRPLQGFEQIDRFIDVVIPRDDEVMVLDVEDHGRLDRLTLTELIYEAMARIDERTGRWPLLYTRAMWLNDYTDARLWPRELRYWLAKYRARAPWPLFTDELPTENLTIPIGVERAQVLFHQTSERGKASLYGSQSYYIDLNRFIGTADELRAYFHAAPVVQPDPEPVQFQAEVTTATGVRLRTRYTPGGALRPQSDWLMSGDTVPVYRVDGDWYDTGRNVWASALYLRRQDYEPPAEVLAVSPLSQRDPRWKNIRLGTGSATIGQMGCLVTCVAMVAKYYGFDTDPKRLNEWLKAHNGYSNGNLLNWYSLFIPVSTWVECLRTPAPLERIDETLAKGEPCIVWVDFDPSTAIEQMHWVLIIGKSGEDDYVMIDPWDGFVGSFKNRYKDARRYIFRIVSYRRQA